jgi:hypothetical protein
MQEIRTKNCSDLNLFFSAGASIAVNPAVFIINKSATNKDFMVH